MDSPFSAAEILEHSHADPADDCSHSHSLQAQRAQKQVSDGYPDGNLDQSGPEGDLQVSDPPEIPLKGICDSGENIPPGHGQQVGQAKGQGRCFLGLQKNSQNPAALGEDDDSRQADVEFRYAEHGFQAFSDSVSGSGPLILGGKGGHGGGQAVAGSQYIAVCDGDGVEGGHSVYAQTVDAGLDQKAAQVQHGLLKRRHRAVINGLFEKFPLDPHL